MADRPRSGGDHPDPETVFEVLNDDACREILSTLAEPMSASRIADEAEKVLAPFDSRGSLRSSRRCGAYFVRVRRAALALSVRQAAG